MSLFVSNSISYRQTSFVIYQSCCVEKSPPTLLLHSSSKNPINTLSNGFLTVFKNNFKKYIQIGFYIVLFNFYFYVICPAKHQPMRCHIPYPIIVCMRTGSDIQPVPMSSTIAVLILLFLFLTSFIVQQRASLTTPYIIDIHAVPTNPQTALTNATQKCKSWVGILRPIANQEKVQHVM